MRAKTPIRQRLLDAVCGLVAIAAAIGAPWPARAAEAATPTRRSSRLGVSTGFDWSTGDYGESLSTEIWYVPLHVRYEWRHWLFRVTLPYIRVTAGCSVRWHAGRAQTRVDARSHAHPRCVGWAVGHGQPSVRRRHSSGLHTAFDTG